jgi:hypothetical protein
MRIAGLTARCGVWGVERLARGWRGSRPGWRVQTSGVVDQPFFKCTSAVQPLGNAGEDDRDVAGAELAWAGGRVPLECSGEFTAVVDELAHECEEATGAAFLGWSGWVGLGLVPRCGGHRRDRHERNRNRPSRQGIYSAQPLGERDV